MGLPVYFWYGFCLEDSLQFAPFWYGFWLFCAFLIWFIGKFAPFWHGLATFCAFLIWFWHGLCVFAQRLLAILTIGLHTINFFMKKQSQAIYFLTIKANYRQTLLHFSNTAFKHNKIFCRFNKNLTHEGLDFRFLRLIFYNSIFTYNL